MTTCHNPHAGRTSTVKPPAQGQGTDTGDAQSRPVRRRRQASVRNSGARHVCEVATWDTADSAGAGGMPGKGTSMAEKDQANMKLWSAYLIGYHNGVEAMQNAVPIGDPNPFNLTTLLRELRAQERRDDE